MYWVDIGRAQRMGLKFIQTRSNAITLHDTLPSIWIERVVSRKTEEVLYTKTKLPSLAPTVILEANGQKDWNAQAAARGSSSQPMKPNEVSCMASPVILRSRAALDQQNMEDDQKDNEEFDQACTGQPVVQNSGTLNFRIQGLLFSRVQEAEHGRVRDLIGQIESHPHRHDLQADLRQHSVYSKFSENSKKMIHGMGNVEYSELCVTGSQVVCSYCISYWADSNVYNTYGICLPHTDDMRRLNRKQFDASSISNYVIDKGCSHGARHGISEEQIYCHQ